PTIRIWQRAAIASCVCATACCTKSRRFPCNVFSPPAASMWIDTHCHLDASEFDTDRDAVAAAARASGVGRIVIPGVARMNFARVRELAHRVAGGAYALGIHPLFTPRAQD